MPDTTQEPEAFKKHWADMLAKNPSTVWHAHERLKIELSDRRPPFFWEGSHLAPTHPRATKA